MWDTGTAVAHERQDTARHPSFPRQAMTCSKFFTFGDNHLTNLILGTPSCETILCLHYCGSHPLISQQGRTLSQFRSSRFPSLSAPPSATQRIVGAKPPLQVGMMLAQCLRWPGATKCSSLSLSLQTLLKRLRVLTQLRTIFCPQFHGIPWCRKAGQLRRSKSERDQRRGEAQGYHAVHQPLQAVLAHDSAPVVVRRRN